MVSASVPFYYSNERWECLRRQARNTATPSSGGGKKREAPGLGRQSPCRGLQFPERAASLRRPEGARAAAPTVSSQSPPVQAGPPYLEGANGSAWEAGPGGLTVEGNAPSEQRPPAAPDHLAVAVKVGDFEDPD